MVSPGSQENGKDYEDPPGMLFLLVPEVKYDPVVEESLETIARFQADMHECSCQFIGTTAVERLEKDLNGKPFLWNLRLLDVRQGIDKNDHNYRVKMWDTARQAIISGFAAPRPENVKDFLRGHPTCEVYVNQEKSGSRKRKRNRKSRALEEWEASAKTILGKFNQGHIPSPCCDKCKLCISVDSFCRPCGLLGITWTIQCADGVKDPGGRMFIGTADDHEIRIEHPNPCTRNVRRRL